MSSPTPLSVLSTGTPSELKAKLLQLRHALRPGQRELADWQAGTLAVSAVPGAGKSYGMAVAAAITLARVGLRRCPKGDLRPSPHTLHASVPQLVMVTFTRSAAANLKQHVCHQLQKLNLPPVGFTVQTLHGLALNIATHHPQLSKLNLDEVTLVSANRKHRLMGRCVDQWVATSPHLYQMLLERGDFDGEETERLRRHSVLRTEVLPALAEIVIREAKSSGLTPQDLDDFALQVNDDLSILKIAAGLYDRYQALLLGQQWIDYDDMILAALRVLEDEQARRQWQTQVLAVFEDEAQDSTPLQTKLLETLASHPEQPSPNLIRVGDPNQAINSTFTPADPIFFRQFCAASQPLGRLATMTQAGRSAVPIMAAANWMLHWVNRSGLAGSAIPFREQTIQAVAADDPQADANPAAEGQGCEIYRPRDIYHTLELIAHRVQTLLTAHPKARAAVLVRENKQGRFIAEVLNQPAAYGLKTDLPAQGIEIFDVGSRDRRSHVPAELLTLLQFLARPHSPDYLKAALSILVNRQLIPVQDLNVLASQPEQFLYPGPIGPPQTKLVRQARDFCCKLLRARWELPHYQLISFLALALGYGQAELATADKLASRLIQQTQGHTAMVTTLPALQEIVSAEKFEPVEVDDESERDVLPQQLTIITMHKAKGLDWDYVFLPFLQAKVIPGDLWVPNPAKFLGDFTLAEVARAQIRACLHQDYPIPDTLEAWQRACDLKIAEEFRLLYVAMTRAKRLLWLAAAHKAPYSWHTFDWRQRSNLEEQAPCPVLPPLMAQFSPTQVQ